jgi:hypothetical protein
MITNVINTKLTISAVIVIMLSIALIALACDRCRVAWQKIMLAVAERDIYQGTVGGVRKRLCKRTSRDRTNNLLLMPTRAKE